MCHRYFYLTLAALFSLAISLPSQASGDEGLARKLINSQGCKACHSMEGDGGVIAGSFEEMREKLSRIDIRLKLFNQAGTHGNSTIPDFSHLSKEQLDALVDFIQPER